MSSKPRSPALWCGQHDRWESPPGACETAFDPDAVSWLVEAGDGE